jgi:ADP-ribose pyrophosphatase
MDLPTLWPTLRSEVLGRGAISSFVNDVVQTPNGETMHRQYLSHPGAVAVIALDEADRVVVVRQYRHPVGFVLTEPPAGLLDSDDVSPLIAAQRELAEEALLAADDWRLLVDIFSSPGCNEEGIRFFLARGLRPAPRPEGFVVEHEELDMEVCLVHLADLVDAVFAGAVQSPTIVAGILALEAARVSGRLDELRPGDSPWPARQVHAERHSSA